MGISLQTPHQSLWARALFLVLALAIGVENFRAGVTLRLTHSHSHDASAAHGHPYYFEGLAKGGEVPTVPSEGDPMEHTHIIQDFPDQSSQQVSSSKVVVTSPMIQRSWAVIESIMGPSRRGDSLFRPPC